MTQPENLSDAELSRRIAESLEPFTDRLFPLKEYTNEQSPLGCWVCTGWAGKRKYLPRDMVHDPEMTVMLLTQGRLSVWPRRSEPEFRVGVDWGKSAVHLDIGRAVAEAYARAKGLL